MLIRSVETFLRRHAMSATQFGLSAARDPRLVRDLRDGREPRPKMEQRIRGFMEGYERARGVRPAIGQMESNHAR